MKADAGDEYEKYMEYESFVLLVGLGLHIEEITGKSSPLWVHNDLSRRLASVPRQDWVAFSYDEEWGLLLVYRTRMWHDTVYRGIVYRKVDAATAAIMLQYVSVTHMDAVRTAEWFAAGYGQITITGMHLSPPYLIRNGTCIPFPPPRPKPSLDDD